MCRLFFIEPIRAKRHDFSPLPAKGICPAGRNKVQLVHQTVRRPVVEQRIGMQGSDTHMLKGIIDDEASGFFSIALSPDTAIKPKAEFARKADETDQPAIIHSPYR